MAGGWALGANVCEFSLVWGLEGGSTTGGRGAVGSTLGGSAGGGTGGGGGLMGVTIGFTKEIVPPGLCSIEGAVGGGSEADGVV